ncbi:MAG: hypothetical protein ACLP1X_19100 [Polyangiaceae bacterium]
MTLRSRQPWRSRCSGTTAMNGYMTANERLCKKRLPGVRPRFMCRARVRGSIGPWPADAAPPRDILSEEMQA